MEVELPKAASGEDISPSLLSLVINKEGTIFLNGKAESADGIDADLKAFLKDKTPAELEAIVAADQGISMDTSFASSTPCVYWVSTGSQSTRRGRTSSDAFVPHVADWLRRDSWRLRLARIRFGAAGPSAKTGEGPLAQVRIQNQDVELPKPPPPPMVEEKKVEPPPEPPKPEVKKEAPKPKPKPKKKKKVKKKAKKKTPKAAPKPKVPQPAAPPPTPRTAGALQCESWGWNRGNPGG